MPLSMVKEGEPNVIKKVGGKEETRRFLENLGFVAGGTVTVVSEVNGNMIVNVKESRVAIGKDMANKIMVNQPEGGNYEDIKRSSLRSDRKGEKTVRRGTGKETYHGHGYYQGRGRLCKKGCSTR